MSRGRLAALACTNGLGHAMRTAAIVDALLRRRPDCSVTLWCAPWHVDALDRWHTLHALRVAGVELAAWDPPIRWRPDGGYGAELASWRDAIAGLRLDRFDVVYTDNLIEPLVARPDAILGGSFFWHDILVAANPQLPGVRRYAAWAESLLSEARPTMLASRLFAMPGLIRHAAVEFIDLVPVAGPTDVATGEPPVALLATGSSAARGGAARSVLHWVDALRRLGLPAAGEPALVAQDKRLRQFNRFGHSPPVAVMVGRAGMGTIADAMAHGAPLLWIDDDNPEIRHNQQQLQALGLGAPMAEVAELDSAAFNAWLEQARPRADAVGLNGAAQAAAVLEQRLSAA